MTLFIKLITGEEKTLDDFLQVIKNLPLLIKFKKDEFTKELFNKYNQSLITPQECLNQLIPKYFFSTALESVVRSAQQYSIELVPIGYVGVKVFNEKRVARALNGEEISIYDQDYLSNSNQELIKNIQSFINDCESNAGLIIGYERKEVITNLENCVIEIILSKH